MEKIYEQLEQLNQSVLYLQKLYELEKLLDNILVSRLPMQNASFEAVFSTFKEELYHYNCRAQAYLDATGYNASRILNLLKESDHQVVFFIGARLDVIRLIKNFSEKFFKKVLQSYSIYGIL